MGVGWVPPPSTTPLKTKQNETPLFPQWPPYHDVAPAVTQFLKPKTLEFSLTLFCSCLTFNLSPNPVTSIFKICLEFYSPSPPSSSTGFLHQLPSPNSSLYSYPPLTHVARLIILDYSPSQNHPEAPYYSENKT